MITIDEILVVQRVWQLLSVDDALRVASR
jgi:hypothetical protein